MVEKNTKGITLIVLVITIIVLLILAGVTIGMLIGENGILGKSQKASEETNKQTATEIINLKITNAQVDNYAEKQKMPTLKELSLLLKEDEEIQYITEASKVASVEYNVNSENPNKIYTKLKEYPYEFEINSLLKVASVDGIKIGNSETENNGEEDNKTDNSEVVSKEQYDDLVNKIEDLKNEMVSKEQYNNLIEKTENLKEEVENLKNHSTPMIDTSRPLKELRVNEAYIATEDCFFVGSINTKTGGWWSLNIDGVDICGIGQNGASNCSIAFPSVFIKKGSKICITSGADYYYDMFLNIYRVK